VSHIPSSTQIDRALTSEEHAVVRWLLEHGDGDNTEFLEQLEHARVARLCGCGCASIDFSISGQRPNNFAMRTLSDYQWSNDQGHLCGAFVFMQDGLLAGLDLWSIDGQCTPNAMPPIERLVPLGSARA
jgi:hypothetical protein